MEMLNMLQYAWIHLKKKQSSKYARILNVPDGVHSIRSLINEQLLRLKRFQNTVKYLSKKFVNSFAKRLMPECG